MYRPETVKETILEPDLPIIDPHHHLWDRPAPPADESLPRHSMDRMTVLNHCYLQPELLADLTSGHKVIATVYLEASSMYRADGPEDAKSIGETEFVNGVAAMFASGRYGDIRAIAGIVGRVDLMLGDAAGPLLDAHMAVAPDRFRGVRNTVPWDADPAIIGARWRQGANAYANPKFRAGFRHLAPRGLSFDAWLFEPQLPDVVSLAQAFPDTQIILDHVGTPLGIGAYVGRLEERFPIWRNSIKALAACPNVTVKVGGLAMPFLGFDTYMSETPAGSEQLAADWRPYVETCIEAFGVDRCMFESNFPVDLGACNYAVLWNAFKRIAAGASAEEKTALFSGTARRVYRLSV